ncbi:MAG: dynamin family protein [Pseudomonadota bacterium]
MVTWNDLRIAALDIERILESEEVRASWKNHGLSELGPRPTLTVFTGAWNSGKSTLINGLTDRPGLLPTGPLPVTTLVTEIRPGAVDAFYLQIDGRREVFASSDLLNTRIAGLDPAALTEKDVALIELAAMPFDNAVMVDTPGTNAPLEIHEILTNSYVPLADAVVYVFQAGLAGQADDLQRLKRIMLRNKPENVFVVLNRIGTFNEKERDELGNFLLERLGPDRAPAGIHFTEAVLTERVNKADAEAYERALNDGGIAELRSTLKRYIDHQGDTAVRNTMARNIVQLAREQAELWKDELGGLDKTEDELLKQRQLNEMDIQRFDTDLARAIADAAVQLKIDSADMRLRLDHGMERCRVHAEELVARMQDPSSDMERAALTASIMTLLDEAIHPVMTEAQDCLKERMAGIPEALTVPALLQERFQIPEAASWDLTRFVEGKLEELQQYLELLIPYLQQMKHANRQFLVDGMRTVLALARTHVDKLRPVFEMLSTTMPREDPREVVRQALSNYFMNVSGRVVSEFALWWDKASEEVLEVVEHDLQRRIREAARPVRDALECARQGGEKVAERKQALTDLIGEMEQRSAGIEGA